MTTKALVVLSGGQDSTTCLFWAKKHFDEVHAVTFDYGQRHRIEIHAARKVAEIANVKSWEVIEVAGILKSTSPLTSNAIELEQYKDHDSMAQIIGNRIELTFVPMRNTLFLTIAANHAISLDCRNLVTGICQEDNANYPDCRDGFRMLLEATINASLGVKDFEVLAPLMDYSKRETVRLARNLPGCWEALAYTHTSYAGDYPPLDNNHASVLRARGFLEADLPDPLILRAHREGLMQLPNTYNYRITDLTLRDDTHGCS